MRGRELVKKTLAFENPQRLPRDLFLAPGLAADDILQVKAEFPLDFAAPKFFQGKGDRERGAFGESGEYTDPWGCTWRTLDAGTGGYVVGHPLENWDHFTCFQPPWEYLERLDLSAVNLSYRQSEDFMLAPTKICPFERLQHLRGTEAVLMDLATGEPRFFELLAQIHHYNLAELKLWLETNVDGVFLMDDWGWQGGLLVSPKVWRHFFKPLYREYFHKIREAGKTVFFHSDGQIQEIFGDLVALGADAINSQLFCMDWEQLAPYRGKVTFWGEFDQELLLHGDLKQGVAALCNHFWAEGGLIAHCRWERNIPGKRIKAAFESYERCKLSKTGA